MKIALFGHGKMGKLVERLALKQGDQLVTPKIADVCIDFSHAECVVNHVNEAIKAQKPIVIGTTGWDHEINTVKAMVEKNLIAALYAPNFSLGMALFQKILKYARQLYADYEVAGVEYHHSQKMDAPSGTAKSLAKTLEMKTPFASVRCGRIPGKHEVIFDSPLESVTLTHEAHNREGWALGALKAAEWIRNKKGWYTLDDLLGSLYSTDYTL